MSDGNQLPPAGETACPTYFAKRLIQQGGAGGFACRSHGHNQWSASRLYTPPNGGAAEQAPGLARENRQVDPRVLQDMVGLVRQDHAGEHSDRMARSAIGTDR